MIEITGSGPTESDLSGEPTVVVTLRWVDSDRAAGRRRMRDCEAEAQFGDVIGRASEDGIDCRDKATMRKVEERVISAALADVRATLAGATPEL